MINNGSSRRYDKELMFDLNVDLFTVEGELPTVDVLQSARDAAVTCRHRAELLEPILAYSQILPRAHVYKYEVLCITSNKSAFYVCASPNRLNQCGNTS